MRRLAATLALLLGCGSDLRPPDGVYSMCREVAGYSGETIELKDGRFRYWFYSDVVTGNEPAYPLTGAYRISGDTLTLSHSGLHDSSRTIAKVGETWVLWRDDTLDLWNKEKRLHPYGILLRTEAAAGDLSPNARPSIKALETTEMKKRDRKEYDGRFMDRPEPSRGLLRARSMEGDGEMAAYKAAIQLARDPLDPRLPAQLIESMGRDSASAIEAESILEDLYLQTWLIPTPPSFLAKPDARKRSLEILIDGFTAAPDRSALEKTLLLFLGVSGVGKLDLAVPDTDLRIILEALPNNGGRYASEGGSADDTRWLKLMPKLIPACQDWMRAQLPK